MKNTETIVDGIEKSNLSDEAKKELIVLLKRGNKIQFIIAVLRAFGVGTHVFELFDLDIGDLVDKFL